MKKENLVLKTLWDEIYERTASLSNLYEIQKKQKKGMMLNPFAAGHIVASELAAVIEETTRYRASWGQVLKKNGTLSGEVDVVVFDGGPAREWKQAHYAIILEDTVRATFECDTNLSENRKYKEKIKIVKFKNVPAYIFSLHCYSLETTYKRRKKELEKIGWKGVYAIFLGKEGDVENRDDWYSLMRQLKKL